MAAYGGIISKLSPGQKKTIAVLVPEGIGAPAATLGAVYCMEKIPKQVDWLSNVVAKHIVTPHLETFEYLAKGLRKAHDDYDEHKNALRIAEGLKPLESRPETRAERAFAISDGLVKTFLALGADFGATLLLQTHLNKKLEAGIVPFKTASTELVTHLCAMAAMPTIFPKASENLHYGILSKKLFQKTLHMDKEAADERSRALTYVTLPGYLGAAMSLFYAHSKNGDVRR